jgi:ubiquinone/menaquinone biosynthesis C-methylase UbiE
MKTINATHKHHPDVREITSIYDRIAPVYDLWGNLTESKARRRALELAEINDGSNILEVAVGSGLLFADLLKKNPNGFTEGLDISLGMLERAKKKAALAFHKNYRLELGNSDQLPFENSRFDFLFNNYMFDLLPENNFNSTLREFNRVLKSKGRIILVNMTPGIHWYEKIYETMYRINPKWLGACRGVQLYAYLKANGFENVRRETLSQFGFPSEILVANKI